ncbi:hypothetical protein ABB37_04570 [Leptomonas pyrrhocoris]|uniref:Transmembrane protein n=1 Tax=Leptomonas pyrrhocoris TaxID=157538 RepID=A0A0N0VFB9_LEPPY|nr:hypothetical protein ABB37_04570 [Leptomonas pyrrhocoris]KPA80274.1 hypothetical protein ABB37_04570 [Leptomonas pyrrhocoris]|eukprot:XP_015658713.1 hypothetical protein ABB37_04570 [Leptomonas pyrrhocoris]
MVAGTKRGLLLFGFHTFAVHLLAAVFMSFFVEYYVHERLLIVNVRPVKAKDRHDEVQAHLSTWGLLLFVIAQTAYAVVTSLHRFGLLSLVTTAFPSSRVLPVLLRRLSCEQCFALLFGLSWWLLRFPLLPSAVSFTCLFAALSALAEGCSAFTAQAAREMAQQRPKEGEWIAWVARLAAASVAAVVFAAALLYDGAVPRSGRLGGFHWLVLMMSVGALGVFSGLQHVRRRAHAAESSSPSSVREDAEHPWSPPSSLTSADASSAEFHAFARQTCQRRSMKALLAVRALHCYAHSFVLYFAHLVLTLGCGLQLSAAIRAAILGVVIAASSLLSPMGAVVCAVLGKKRGLSMGFAVVAMLGAASLLLAYLTRDTDTAEAAGPRVIEPKPKNFLVEVSTAGTAWCAIMVALQRLVLDALRDMLDLAQEDVVEEDAILFGRASSMTTCTKQLTSVGNVPMQSLSFAMVLLFLAASRAFRVVPAFAHVATSTPPLTNSSRVVTPAPPTLMPSYVVANGSTMLALLGLQTCGVAVAMCVVWQRFYNLDGKHLQFVQMATRKRSDEQATTLV